MASRMGVALAHITVIDLGWSGTPGEGVNPEGVELEGTFGLPLGSAAPADLLDGEEVFEGFPKDAVGGGAPLAPESSTAIEGRPVGGIANLLVQGDSLIVAWASAFVQSLKSLPSHGSCCALATEAIRKEE